MAVNNLGYIGKNNKLLWHCKDDLKHFKSFVYNQKCLVGSTTYENMPKVKWVDFIVVGKNYLNLESALKLNPIWCIGGAKLIESVIDKIEELHLSIIDDNQIGDVKLPDISKIKNVYKYNFKL